MIDREAEAALHNLHEYTKVKRELEVYKKALELACWDLDNYTDTHYVTLMNEYLQKARGQE